MSQDRSDPSRRLEEVGQELSGIHVTNRGAEWVGDNEPSPTPRRGCPLLGALVLLPFLLAGAGLVVRLAS